MYWYIFLATIVGVIIFFPIIRFFIKRIKLSLELKVVCKKLEYRIIKNSIFWWAGSNKNGRCDFYIETPDGIYSIKLFSSLRKNVCIHFKKDQTYFKEKFMILFGAYGSSAKFSFKTRLRRYGNINFKYNFNKAWYNKKFIPIILFSPTCKSLKLETETGEDTIGDGDILYGSYVFGLKGLIKKLNNEK